MPDKEINLSEREIRMEDIEELFDGAGFNAGLRDAIDRASDQDQTTWLTTEGKRIAAIVPVDAAEWTAESQRRVTNMLSFALTESEPRMAPAVRKGLRELSRAIHDQAAEQAANRTLIANAEWTVEPGPDDHGEAEFMRELIHAPDAPDLTAALTWQFVSEMQQGPVIDAHDVRMASEAKQWAEPDLSIDLGKLPTDQWVRVEFYGRVPPYQRVETVDLREVAANLAKSFGFTHIDDLTVADAGQR